MRVFSSLALAGAHHDPGVAPGAHELGGVRDALFAQRSDGFVVKVSLPLVYDRAA